MKKTEKIEIRVSQSEKEALTQLAQVENRSVSEMLRELARKYVLLNKGSTRLQFLRPKAVFALALCFFMGGVVFTQTPRAMAPLPYHISGSTGDTLFGSKISEFGRSEIATENHIITIQYLKSWNTSPKMKIEVFQKEPSLDTPLTMTEFKVNKETPIIWKDNAALGEAFHLMVFNENMKRSELEKALLSY